MTSKSHWLIGLESSPRCSGALQFARWLRETLHTRVHGLYVSEMWRYGVPPGDGAALLMAMRGETERWLASLPTGVAGAAVDETRIVDEIDAENGLARAGREAVGILVGRRIASERSWGRLGRVARRLLRELPAPVIVVPPELAAASFGGPVILATDLGDASLTAARFAAWFARKVDRPLICVHVGEPRWDGLFDEEEPGWAELRDAYRSTTERAARAWVAEELPAAELVVEYGDPTERLPAVAVRRQASLLVVGSGRPGLVQRIFVGSVASAVAAFAPCAVAVVPPEAEFGVVA